MKEATARIKINKLLEAAGWRFFADGDARANIQLEPSVSIKSTDLDALGDNFEKRRVRFGLLLGEELENRDSAFASGHRNGQCRFQTGSGSRPAVRRRAAFARPGKWRGRSGGAGHSTAATGPARQSGDI